MACLPVLVIAATVLLTVQLDAIAHNIAPAGKQLTQAARTSPAEAFWRAALPDAPMPDAIRELVLHPSAAGTKAISDVRPKDDHDDDHPPLPPLNFKYDDYKASASPRNEAAAPSPETLLKKHAAAAGSPNAAASPAVFVLEDAARAGRSRSRLPLHSIPLAEAAVFTSLVVCRRDGAVPVRAYAVVGDDERVEAVAAAAERHMEHAHRWDPVARAAFRLLDVKPPGGAAVVCHAVLLPVGDE